MTNQKPATGRRGGGRSDNRQRLVEAGHEVLSAKGLEATTVKEVARVAGVSPGLFHYYFTSKDELLFAVLWEAGERFQHRLVGQVGPPGTVQDRIEGAVRFVADTAQQDPALFRLRYEFYALGLRNPEFLPVVGEQLAYIKANIVRILGEWFPEADKARIPALAAVILACFDGLALQQLTDRDPDMAPAYALLREVMVAELTP